MKKYKDLTACIYDHGLFLSIAHRLAKDFGTVLYHNPWNAFLPTSADAAIGLGFEDIKKIDNFWDYIDKIDLFIFPEVMDGHIQAHLRKLGKRVWGSGEGEMFENDRWGFLQHLEKLGLNTPDSELVVSIDAFEKRLKATENKFVKLEGEVRGDAETFHHKTWNTTRPLFEKIRHDVGPLGAIRKYILQDPIDSDLEYGFDTWMVKGQFPETLMYGFEIKDLGYVCKIINFSDMPTGILDILEKLRKTFEAYDYTGPFSAELLKDKAGKFYFMDACCRNANPATFCQMLMCDNIAEVMYEGAAGKMVAPVWGAKFGGEVTINSEFIKDHFGELFYPDSLKPWMNRMNSCQVDGAVWSIPNGKSDSFGSVAAVDNDAEKMIETLRKRMDMISGYQVDMDDKGLDQALEKLTG